MDRQALSVGSPASYYSARRSAGRQPKPSRKRVPGRQTVARSSPALSASGLRTAAEDWHLDCEYRAHSVETISTQRIFLKNLAWFLEHRGYATCGSQELKEFFHYLRHGHEAEGGRWGIARYDKAVRPQTAQDYWVCFATFFKWMVAEEVLSVSPLAKIPKPAVRLEEKQPLTPAQVKALFSAAKRSLHPKRDTAIVLLLLDTGIRSSELCGLKLKDIDLHARQCVVLGKGNKVRVVHFGVTTANAIRLHLRDLRHGEFRNGQVGPGQGQRAHDLLGAGRSQTQKKLREFERNEQLREKIESCGPELPLFLADKCGLHIRAISSSGLLQLLERLANDAGIERSCSPHVLRRTFAVTWLRNGANIFSLQAMLGHSDLRMTQRYLSLARADIAEQARQFSPADNLKS